MVADSDSTRSSAFANPWVQLVLGVACMASVANLQYGWTLFVNPIDAKYHWGRAAIQVAFTTFVLIETWLVPMEGYLVDRFGPRPVVLGGGILVAIAWVLNSFADSLALLYFAAAIGGIGTGSVYGTCVGNALKWFPAAADWPPASLPLASRRRRSHGVPISRIIGTEGYQHAFLLFGILQGLIVFIMSFGLLVAPPQLIAAHPRPNQAAHSFAPTQVLRKPVFYVMYLMFVLVAAGGLMIDGQHRADRQGLSDREDPVSLLGLVMPAAVFAITLNRIFDGVRPPVLRLGVRLHRTREHDGDRVRDGGAALFTLSQSGSNPVIFVLVTALYFGVFGEIYSVFRHAGRHLRRQVPAANAGMLYTAKGMGALLGAVG